MSSSKPNIKRTPNGYILFSRAYRKQIAEDKDTGPKPSPQETTTLIGKRWRRMTEEERAPYYAEAEKLRTEQKKAYPDLKVTYKRKKSREIMKEACFSYFLDTQKEHVNQSSGQYDPYLNEKHPLNASVVNRETHADHQIAQTVSYNPWPTNIPQHNVFGYGQQIPHQVPQQHHHYIYQPYRYPTASNYCNHYCNNSQAYMAQQPTCSGFAQSSTGSFAFIPVGQPFHFSHPYPPAIGFNQFP